MCTLFAEIILFAGGLYALIAGKIKLTGSISLEGTRARIAGLFLAAPLPLALITGFGLGILSGAGAVSEDMIASAGFCEIIYIVLGALGAVAYAVLTKPKT
jgi:hypothetical protein